VRPDDPQSLGAERPISLDDDASDRGPIAGPWDANWRPDPTGQRLAAIRVARRGALASAVIFGVLVVVAAALAPVATSSLPGADQAAGVVIALFSLPAVALLGAALTSSARASRSSAAAAGLAMGVGVPVAAVTSAMIAAFFVVWIVKGSGEGFDLAGQILRGGVTAAVRIWPLIALASVAWVVLVRRVGPRL
jgi:hypothetical protein